MIAEILKTLEQFIRTNNPYFTQSFSNASQSPFTGYIMVGEGPVFPADHLGDYFYMRIPNKIGFDDGLMFLHAEGDVRVGMRLPTILVACVRNADPVTLLENLVTTLRQYQPDYIKFQSASFQKEIVITEELALLPKETVQDALSKVDMDYAIVSVSFLYTFPYLFQELSCIQTP